MYPSYEWHMIQSKLQDIPCLHIIHSGGNDRYQSNSKLRLGTVPDSFLLHFHHILSTKRPINIITHSVKLKKHRVQSRFFQFSGIFLFLCKADPISIQLKKCKTFSLPIRMISGRSSLIVGSPPESCILNGPPCSIRKSNCFSISQIEGSPFS